MKKIIGVLLLASIFGACKPEEKAKIGPRYSLTSGVKGAWEISKVEIADLTLPVPENRDITDFYLSNLLELEFDTDAGTYTVPNPDVLGNPFGASGTFLFDANDYPTAMMMITDESDTLNLQLENMVREIDPYMGFTYTKSACGVDYASYTYTFKRK